MAAGISSAAPRKVIKKCKRFRQIYNRYDTEMWLFGIVLALASVEGTKTQQLTINTNQGLIRGLRADDGDYYKFLGIPYARVDKNKPFGRSIPYGNFKYIYEAYNNSIACPQVNDEDLSLEFSLDCLRLNIYVPEQASSINKLPVLIYIHGGSFIMGSGKIGPKFFMQHDVLMVSIQYRLGPYGFMCLDTPEVPGNQGLKDQYLALQWIKNNICAFGGDVNKITVMGQSAGSASIDFHLLSKNPKLFHRAILQSGTATNPLAIVRADKTIPNKLAAELGYKTEGTSEAMRFLEKIDPNLVIAASSKLSLIYRPCVEKKFKNVERVVYTHPEHADVSRAKNISLLIGYNTLEYYIFHQNVSRDFYRTLDVFRENLGRNFDLDDDHEMEESARRFYMGDDKASEKTFSTLHRFTSDYNFAYSNERTISDYIANENQSIYQYYFTYVGDRNLLSGNNPAFTTHTDELNYLFTIKSDKYKQPSEADQLAIARITSMWSNFVKCGDPTPKTTDLLPVKWLPVTKDKFYYLHFGTELELGIRPNQERTEYWNQFYKLYEGRLKANRGFYRN